MPKVNTFDHVYFDGTIPIFNEPRDMNKEFASQALFQISKEEIESDYKIINDFIDYLISCVSEKYKNSLYTILQTRELGWNNNKKRVGILFPSAIVDSFPVC